ncbi:hypothetical protein OO17_24395 [Rhodopseudomonas palustris]|uniref:Uncharacterized protein n=2 Tax=Nitrobacteraceae TaxID=41294 RepID=A0A0D7E748_RHOPL|nr:hypothetical protein OO17_24395 [Rhodopseudomonas palustris]
MHEYRLYLISREDGSFIDGIDLVARDDGAALAAAQQQAITHDIELWQGTRWMAQIRSGDLS